jgi:hypothetical protein
LVPTKCGIWVLERKEKMARIKKSKNHLAHSQEMLAGDLAQVCSALVLSSNSNTAKKTPRNKDFFAYPFFVFQSSSINRMYQNKQEQTSPKNFLSGFSLL